jgi:tetratricopeptide (TPR) repeat protein
VRRLNPWYDVEVALEGGHYDAAVAHASKSVESGTDSTTDRARAYLYRGVARLALAHHEDALADFEAARDMQINRITLFALNEAYRVLGDWERALPEFSSILSSAPGYLFAAWQRADINYQRGEYSRAWMDWHHAARLDWPSPTAYRVRKRHEKPDLTILLTAVRGWTDYYSTLGHTDTDTSGLPADPAVHERAIAECQRVLEQEPGHAVAYGLRGAARWHLGQLSPARADLDTAIGLDPRLAAAHRFRGLVLQEFAEHEAAIRDLTEAARLDPNHADHHAALALALATCPDVKRRDIGAAVEYGTLACQLTKWKDPDSLTALAVALAAAGKFQEAITWQESALMFPGYQQRCGRDAEKRLQAFAAGRAGSEPASEAIKSRRG